MRLGLGPTNPGTITVALETLLLRPTGFSPVLWLLIPAFSLDTAPPDFPIRLRRDINAPLPLAASLWRQNFQKFFLHLFFKSNDF